MLTQAEQDALVTSVTIPELRSCVQRLLDSMETDPEASASYRLTLLALISFYRKNMQVDYSVETDLNQLKSRLIETGVLYFGPLHDADRPSPTRARMLVEMRELGFCIEHLAFLNATQVELLHTYVRETGLIHG